MSDDIREKAQALIKLMDESENGTGVIVIKQGSAYQDLKAALRPSREDIADYLENIEHDKMILDSVLFGQLVCGKEGLSLHSCNESKKYLNYAIEELRKPL